MKRKIIHFIHYFLSALSGVVLDWIVWWIIKTMTGNPILAQCISKSASAILGFYLYRKVFQHKDSPYVKFTLAVMWSWICSVLFLKILSIHFNIYGAKIITDGITFIMNYGIMKYLVFKKKGKV